MLVVGPRQCGKSTLVRKVLPRWRHLDLERPLDFEVLSADLEGFLIQNPAHVAFDEAQRLPELFPVLRHVLDTSPRKGRFVLLGSASPALLQSASETLSGRVALLELTPFRAVELAKTKHAGDRWFWGGYPPVHAQRSDRARSEWLASYVATFLERDLPMLGLRLPSARLRTLWTMLTHVHGNLLNASDLARSLCVSSHTVQSYLDVLSATFMVRLLPPYHANVQKRLTKSPKVYIRDTGLLHFLGGLRRPAELDTWAYRGASFEGMVIEEIVALAEEREVRPEAFFWRTQAGAEVDLLLATGRELLAVEIKAGASVDASSLRGLKQCMTDLGLTRSVVIYTGRERRAIGGGIELVPWDAVVRREIDFPFLL